MTPTLLLLAMLAGEPPAPPTTVQADDPTTIRMRIDLAMKAIEEKLRQAKVDDDTKSLQEEVLREIDKLLHMKNNSPPPPPSGPPPPSPPSNGSGDTPPDNKSDSSNDPTGGSGSKSKTPSNNAPKSGTGEGNRERMDREQPASTKSQGGTESRRERRAKAGKSDEMAKNPTPAPGRPGERGEPKPSNPGNRPGEADGNPGNNPDQATGAKMPPMRPGNADRLGDVSRDVWGHLPESLRQEVDHYYKERFMPRYKELLQQYYNRLAEADRKPGDKK